MKNQFIYNPEDGYPHSHAASLAKVNFKGRETLLACWYAYPEKEHEKARLAFSVLEEDGSWSKGQWVFDQPTGYSQGNPVLINMPNGDFGLLFVFIEGNYWDEAVVYFSAFSDGKFQNWKKTNIPKGVMIRHRPVLMNNEMLLPAYHEKNNTCNFLTSSDGISWHQVSEFGPEMIQGDITVINEQQIQCFIRPTTAKENVLRVASADGGKSWMNPVRTSLYCPLSGVAAVQCDDLTVVAHNHTPDHKRNPLTISVSLNKGHEWKCHWNIEESNLEFSYPTMVAFNNEIHVLYTFNRKMIKYISLTTDELKERMKDQGCL